MLKRVAMLLGSAFLVAGALGFVPGITSNGHLLGLFHVDALHNVIHIVTGTVAVIVAYKSEHAARVFLQVLGVGYGLIALLGYFYGSRPVLGFLSNNLGDALLHTAIAAVALFYGYAWHRRRRDEHAHA